MRNRIREFFNLEGSLWRYIVGTTLLAVSAQVAYDLAKGLHAFWGPFLLLAVLLALFIFTLGMHLWAERQFQNYKPSRFRKAPRRAGLIMLVSPGNHWMEAFKAATEFHGRSLRAVWLVHSREGVENTNAALAHLAKEYSDVQSFGDADYEVDPEELLDTWQVVDRIYLHEAPRLGLSESQIVADITFGQKPMSAGMALAAATPTRSMQYLHIPRSPASGKIRKGRPPIPKLIKTSPQNSRPFGGS
jgi:hypothetical protein